jgi:hypothetical protein
LATSNILDIGEGSAFPTLSIASGVLAAGARFFRTDLNFACVYDGTRWLTQAEYECNLTPFAISPLPFGTAGNTILLAPSRSDYAYYVTRARVYLFISPTNTGAAFYTFQLQDDGATLLWQFNTSGNAAGQILIETASFSNNPTTVSNYLNLLISAKTGAPSNITAAHMTVWYRLVIP